MQYFYDLALIDARGELSTALTVLYYGSEIGAFSGSEKIRHNLDAIQSLKIDLTEYAAKHEGTHSYALIFFERRWNKQVWRMKTPKHKKRLKSISTRVQLSTQITDKPAHEHHPLTSSKRYIDFTEYPEIAAAPNVPAGYINQFNRRFIGYLMRSDQSFDYIHTLFSIYELQDILEAKFDTSRNYYHIQMAAYGKAS